VRFRHVPVALAPTVVVFPRETLSQDDYRSAYPVRISCDAAQVENSMILSDADRGLRIHLRECCDQICDLHRTTPGIIIRQSTKSRMGTAD
jgi:hypothetical protein